jgi:hypothetical protein
MIRAYRTELSHLHRQIGRLFLRRQTLNASQVRAIASRASLGLAAVTGPI